METVNNEVAQLNLKLSNKIMTDAKSYVDEFGYNNIQELIRESIRDKIYSGKLNPEYLKMLMTDPQCHEGIGIEESKKLLKEIENSNE